MQLFREGAPAHYTDVNELASAHVTCPVGAPTGLVRDLFATGGPVHTPNKDPRRTDRSLTNKKSGFFVIDEA